MAKKEFYHPDAIMYDTTTYRCTVCGVEDHDHSHNPPTALNCWNCHAGFQLPLEKMFATKKGMFPVKPEIN